MNNFKSELQKCNSMKEIFFTVNAHYNTDAKIGTISKQIIILNIDKLIAASGVKPKI
jgi:hypothetical protein